MMPLAPSMSPRSRVVRTVRAGVFAAAGTGLAVSAHRVGGGMAPPVWLAGAATVGLFAVALAFTGAQRRLPAIAGLVLASQALMHVAFAVVGAHAMSGPGTAGGVRSLLGMVMCRPSTHAASAAELAAARAALATLHLSTHAPGHPVTGPPGAIVPLSMAGMTTAHLLAATGLAWWLARGERALWRYACRVASTIRGVVGGLPDAALTAAGGAITRTGALMCARWRTLCTPGRAPPWRVSPLL